MKDHDHSYKNLFSHPKMVADLLKGFVHEDWVQQLDFSTLEKLNSSYITDDLRESPLVSLAARLINKGIEVNIYDPFVKEAYDSGTPGAGRGNESVPNLENRLVGDLDELINDAGAVLVGNYYNETVEKLKEAAKTQTVVDLTRLHRDMVSDENYEGICW